MDFFLIIHVIRDKHGLPCTFDCTFVQIRPSIEISISLFEFPSMLILVPLCQKSSL